jgi:hypothetical protein
MMDFHEVQRVRIVAGKYKKNGYGTYMGTYGKIMCCVKVDNDTVQQRNLWKTSIQPLPRPMRPAANTDHGVTVEEITRTGPWNSGRYEHDYTNRRHATEEGNDDDDAKKEEKKAALLRDLDEALADIQAMKAATIRLEERLTTMYNAINY